MFASVTASVSTLFYMIYVCFAEDCDVLFLQRCFAS